MLQTVKRGECDCVRNRIERTYVTNSKERRM